MENNINWEKVADRLDELGAKYQETATQFQRTKLKYKAPVMRYRAASCFDMAEAIRAGLTDNAKGGE